MNNKTYDKYINAMKRGHVWSKAEINGITKLINRRDSICSDSDKDKIAELSNKLYNRTANTNGFRITEEQTKQGIDYLNNYCFKSNGETRNKKDMPFNYKQLNIIRTFKRFTFVGLEDIGELRTMGTGHVRSWFMPVYRVHGKGGHFDYTCGHWETPMVIGDDGYGHPTIQKVGAPIPIKKNE